MMWPRFEPSAAYTCRVLVGGELREQKGESFLLLLVHECIEIEAMLYDGMQWYSILACFIDGST